MRVWQPMKMLLTPGTHIYDNQSSVKVEDIHNPPMSHAVTVMLLLYSQGEDMQLELL